jgi:hypothetical protein
MNASLDKTEAAILNRLFQPVTGGWSPAAAEAILSLHFDSADRDRMSALLDKANTDEVTAEERVELDHYRHVGKMLELMKSRARASLKTAHAA